MYETDIPSVHLCSLEATVRIDYGKGGIDVIQPKSVQFPPKHSRGTAERRMLPIIMHWASTVHKMQVVY